MHTLVLVIHVILAVSLVGLVLLQQGKGADVGAVMSGGGANTLFGVGGASSLLVRMTTGVAIMFMLTSVLLVRFSAAGSGGSPGRHDAMSGSVVESVEVKPAQAPSSASTPGAAPVVPVPPQGDAASSEVTTTPAATPSAGNAVEKTDSAPAAAPTSAAPAGTTAAKASTPKG